MTTIDSKELYEVLAETPAEQNIMLAGKHGIGKSQILTKYFEDQGMKVVPLFLGQMSDPGDLIGLPDRDSKAGKTLFLPPFWFPLDNTPVVLFLDELNRARPEILQSVMDLALNKTIAGRKLPEGSRIISAVNSGDEYQLTDLDPALISRFNIYEFKPSAAEWIMWANKNGIDYRVIGFIQENAGELDGQGYSIGETDSLEKTPDRRGWEKVSNIIKNRENLSKTTFKTICGIIGAGAATKFNHYLKETHLLGAKDVFAGFEKVQTVLEKYNMPQIALVNDSLYQFFEGTTANKIPKNTAENFLAYAQWLRTSKRNEGLAHLANNFTDPHYDKAKLFIINSCPELYELFVDFISEM
ncbi:AAA family ATPase [Treponema sp.]|uniref:AAA family ATPase n=1 Tax=Treponema sp. TaxID=166 RepID=UPI002A80D5FD|nr:AAA family ATPase [Treponema sp.]MDY4133584.1 AAA family ATPase [Treponema sp.]